MIKKIDIVVVGDLNINLILTGLPSFFEMGKNKLSKDMDFTLGSASAIFASNIAKLGKKVGFLGKIGDDILGDYILQSLLSRNVDTPKIIRVKNEKTGICVSISFPENYAMASFPNVRESFCLEDIDFDYISTARHMHLSSYYFQPGLREGCTELFKHAKELGVTRVC
jgi:sugar/nucleoside kinase (ribokinase family)